jgi:hypothetical protein
VDEELKKLLAIAQKKLRAHKLIEAFDPYNLEAKPTPAQLQFFKDITKYKHRYAVGGNQSGKTASGAWECQAIFKNSHPWWKPHEITGKPVVMLVIGRTSKQYASIWEDKIKPFLEPGDFKERRNAGVLDSVVNCKNGNKILFFSHNNPEDARQKVQHFVADWVWLDEMPNSFNLIEELHRRAMSSEAGRFLATFTPKIVNEKIRKLVETTTDYHKKYVFRMLDNPKLEGRHSEILAPMATMPEAYRKTVLEGEWYAGDTAVYHLRPGTDIVGPSDYSPAWRHLESIDPAAKGLAGLTLFAEDPRTGVWYVVKSEYIKGAAATTLLDKIRPITDGYNIVRRICDPHEVWFMDEAAKQGRAYWGVESKNNRKLELINNLKEAILAERLKVAPWCTDLIDEFNSCQWSETQADRIVGASRFHLLDSVQYGLDRLPKKETVETHLGFDQQLRAANQRRKKAEARRATVAASRSKLGRPGKIWARRGFKGRKRRSHGD